MDFKYAGLTVPFSEHIGLLGSGQGMRTPIPGMRTPTSVELVISSHDRWWAPRATLPVIEEAASAGWKCWIQDIDFDVILYALENKIIIETHFSGWCKRRKEEKFLSEKFIFIERIMM